MPRQGEDQTLYIALSPLEGVELRRFAATLPPDSVVLAVEFESRLAALWRSRGEQSGGARSVKLVCTPEELMHFASEAIRRVGIRRSRTLYLSAAARLPEYNYPELVAAVDRQIQQFWQNRATQIRLMRRWFGNIWRNVTRASLSLEQFAALVGESTVLVGAGPSLDDAVDDLARLAKTRSIIALDTALPALAEHGIRPDLIVSLDGQLANARDLFPYRWTDIPIAMDISAHPTFSRRAGGRPFLFTTEIDPVAPWRAGCDARVLEGLPRLRPRGSVAPAALDLVVRYARVREVILVGVDFAFRPPATHARMSTAHRYVISRISRVRCRDGYDPVLLRPKREALDTCGRRSEFDQILLDQAQQMNETVAELSRLRADLIVLRYTAGRCVADIRVKEYSSSGTSAARVPDRGSETRREPQALRLDARESAARRRAAVVEIRDRLEAQATVLADSRRPVILDDDLSWAFMDLPQWPRLLASTAWAEANRSRLLRAVLDMRRRVERALRSSG